MKSLGDLETFPSPAFIFAHQGGWDEILLVVGPLAIVGFLLWVANRRVEAQMVEAQVTKSQVTKSQITESERLDGEEEQGSPEQR